jgi:malate dehydrogenase (oxaloacetate-decarboxylating)
LERYEERIGADGGRVVRVAQRGARLLNHSMHNKSTAFTPEERGTFALRGLLPPSVTTLDQQARRAYESITRKADPLERYIGLAALQDRNEVLFYRVLLDHLEEFLPIVYTPTVGRACQEYSHIFRRARGLWISPDDRGRVGDVLGDAPFEDVRLIVATDNESILGIGDQGAGGMGIPIGKLALYTAAAGIHPSRTLPVSLDVGTDNQQLLDDDLYIGWRHPRLRGEEYLGLIDEFVEAVGRRFPRAVLQWEDFRKQNAFELLERHRRSLPSFNDDIQGTAAIALAAILAGSRVTGVPLERQVVVVLGAGAAGIGIGRLLREALTEAGVPAEEAPSRVALLDSRGLLVDDRVGAHDFRGDLVWPAALAEQRGLGRDLPRDLAAVVGKLRPTVLIGVSGAPGSFTEEIVREMGSHTERPLIFPMSNPTSQSEAQPAELIAWTDGRALVASGSPFAPVPWSGREVRIGQGNNVFVFPGIGLGALVSGAREIDEGMFLAAARRLAAEVSDADLAAGSLLPPVAAIRRVTARIAAAVVREARDRGTGRPMRDEEIDAEVAAAMWSPRYPDLEPA